MSEKRGADRLKALFAKKPVVVNFGIETFYEDLKKQDVKVIQMNWKPPAGGDRKLSSMLDLLK